MARHPQPSASSVDNRPKCAWLYLRVSTPSQVHTDYNPEGISIPAQRDACARKSAELGASVSADFVEPGRTATSIDKRPVFQEMLAAVRAAAADERPSYIIVYHFNRIFRNSIDAAITKKELAKYGVRVVSTVLDMGDSPESAMVESIIHAVDQYQSQASGADIRYKMGQKAKNGGTVSQTKLGYLNVREAKPEGGEIRTVAVDPERAPFVQQGFELYATGQYSARQVLDRLTAAGLTTRPGHKTSGRTVSLNQFYKLLADRYYTGVITYQDEEYSGRHEPLVTPELFDRVQRVLALHGGGGIRNRQHHHWLKGLLWCGRCGRRLIVMPGRGNGGTYFYFICRGRQDKSCDLGYLKLQDVEKAVEQHFATVRLSDQFRAEVRAQLDDTVLHELGSIDSLKKRLAGTLAALDSKEDGLLDLVGDADWPQARLKTKLAAIRRERAEIEAQLADTTTKLDTGRQFFQTALELLSDPQGFYRRGNGKVRHALTKVVFSKLYLDRQDVTSVSRHDPSEGFGELLEAETKRRIAYRRSGTLRAGNDSSPVMSDGAAGLDLAGCTDLLVAALSGQGSSRDYLVELRGFEPLTL
jgi:site-specific DNA recombinase